MTGTDETPIGFCQYPTRLNEYGMPAETCCVPAVEHRPTHLFVRYVCTTHR
ncbi:hypothetical protein [Planomonospora algeriensis]